MNGGMKRHRRLEWRAAGKRKSERMVWLIALLATLIVVGVTLMAGHLRRKAGPTYQSGDFTSSADGGDNTQ